MQDNKTIGKEEQHLRTKETGRLYVKERVKFSTRKRTYKKVKVWYRLKQRRTVNALKKRICILMRGGAKGRVKEERGRMRKCGGGRKRRNAEQKNIQN